MLKRIVGIAMGILCLGVAWAGEDVSKKLVSVIDEPIPERSALPPGAVTFGGRISEDLADGYVDFLIPLWRGGNDVLFFNPRVLGDDDSRERYSFGMGWRHLFAEQEIIIGANAYYDYIDSPYNNHYDQLGVGVEFLSRWVDARFNYYLPDGEEHLVDRSEDVDFSLSGAYARGNAIYQDSKFTREITELYEGALEGFYAEAGFLVPGLDRYAELRFFGGYYNYEGPLGTDYDGWKARAELKVLPAITLDVEYYEDDKLMGGHWTGGARVTVPFEIGNIFQGRNPFEGITDAFRPRQRQFSERMSDMVIRSARVFTQTEERKRRTVKRSTETLLDNVTFVDNKSAPGGDGTAEDPFDSIQEGVDGAEPDDDDDDAPPNVFVLGGSNYNENVEIDFSLNLIGDGCRIDLGTGKPVIDADGGTGIEAFDAEQVMIASFEILNGEFGITANNVGAFEAHCNYIHDMSLAGIYASGFNSARIYNNVIENVGSGVANPPGLFVPVSGTLLNAGGGGFTSSSLPPAMAQPDDDDDLLDDPAIIEVFDNQIRNVGGDGVAIQSTGSRDLLASVHDNTITDVSRNGVYFQGSGYDRIVQVDVFDNTIETVGSAGVWIGNYDSGGNLLLATVSGNSVTDYGTSYSPDAGIEVYTTGYDYETEIVIADNLVEGANGSTQDGIRVTVVGTRVGADVTIAGNEILDPGQHAIAVQHADSDSSGAGYLNLLVEDNFATGSGVPGDGLYVWTYASSADVDIDAVGNEFTDVIGNGIEILQSVYSTSSAGLGNFSAYIADNTLEASPSSYFDGDGVRVRLSRSAAATGAQGDVMVDVLDNDITGFGSHGIYVFHSATPSGLAPSGTFDANINGNQIVAGSSASGIVVDVGVTDYTYGGGGIPHTIDILSNEMSGVADGVYVNFSADSYGSGGGGLSPLTVNIEDNEITRGDYKGTGIRFTAMATTSYGQGFDTDLTIRNNRIANESYAGIDVMASFTMSGFGPLGTFDLWVNDNTVTFNPSAGGTAIDVSVVGNQDGYGAGLTQNLWVQNNTLNMGSYGDGIAVNVNVAQSGSSFDGTTFTSWIQDNRINGDPEFNGTGIEVYFTGSASYFNDGPFVVDHTITGNRIENLDSGDGIYIQSLIFDSGSYYAAHTFDADVSDNVVNGTPFTGATGIDINLYGPNVDASVVAMDNEVRNMYGAGIRIIQSSYNTATGYVTPSLMAQISGNTVENVDGCGIRVDANANLYEGGQYYVDLTIENNRVEDIGSCGINVDYYVEGSSTGGLFGDFTADIEDNQILGSQSGYGVRVYAIGYNSGFSGTALDASVTVADNRIENPQDGGVYVDYSAYSYGSTVGAFTVDVLDNNISGVPSGDGVFIRHSARYYGSSSGTVGTLDASVQDNRIALDKSGYGLGIEVRTWASETGYGAWAATVDVLNNRVEGIHAGDGILVRQDILGVGSSSGVSTFDVTVEDNVVLDPNGSGTGIEVVTYSTDYREVDATVRVADNRVEGFGGVGIYVEQSAYSAYYTGTPSLVADVVNNHVEDVGGYGIRVAGSGYANNGAFYDVETTITGNTLRDIGRDGIKSIYFVNGSSTGGLLGEFDGTISNNDLADIAGRGVRVRLYGSDYGSSDGGYDATVDILNNNINRASSAGILIDHRTYGSYSGGSLVADVSNNDVVGVPGNDVNGIDIQTRSSSSSGHVADITVSENRVEDFDLGNGVYILASNSGSSSATLNGNRVFDPGTDGIQIRNSGATIALSGSDNNQVTNPGNADFEGIGPISGTIIVNNVAVP